MILAYRLPVILDDRDPCGVCHAPIRSAVNVVHLDGKDAAHQRQQLFDEHVAEMAAPATVNVKNRHSVRCRKALDNGRRKLTQTSGVAQAMVSEPHASDNTENRRDRRAQIAELQQVSHRCRRYGARQR